MTLRIQGGRFRSRQLQVPASSTTRPSTGFLRELISNLCRPYLEGATVLDLFAGSGALGLELLSQGAHHVSFVENERSAASILQANINSLAVASETSLYVADVFFTLNRFCQLQKSYSIIVADPPYKTKGQKLYLSHELLLFLDQHPQLLTADAIVAIEESESVSFSDLPLTHLQLWKERQRSAGQLLLFRLVK